MSDIEKATRKLVTGTKRLERLLALEKRRRGIPVSGLAFVGMHNVAQHWWCTQQAVMTSRAKEIEFFGAYLQDRITYAHRLGLIHKLPSRDDAVLDIGREITLVDVEGLLKNELEESSGQHQPPNVSGAVLAHIETVDPCGKHARLVNPDLPDAERTFYEKEAEAAGIRVMNIEENPIRRGVFFHATRAETYPTLRWNFAWRKYTVVGVADGLTNEFVYEYKTTRSRYLLSFMKPVALAQADLYGHFFERPGSAFPCPPSRPDIRPCIASIPPLHVP